MIGVYAIRNTQNGKSKIESIHESIVDYQNEICELNNSINNLDYNISTTTNEILQLLK